jgi:thiol-disulfide isomerase/thioredoxin
MRIKRNHKLVVGMVMLLCFVSSAQQTVKVYKVDQLLKRLKSSDTIYVVNFWATWCKPCVEELPILENFQNQHKAIKVLLVTLDFKEDLQKRVIPFLQKKNYTTECVLLDETNGQTFIDKLDKRWSGAIPMTLICKNRFSKKEILERKLKEGELEELVE